VRRVLAENGVIIVLALVTLVIGAFVESIVLKESMNYARIVQLALMA
jgi:hypothetical protein